MMTPDPPPHPQQTAKYSVDVNSWYRLSLGHEDLVMSVCCLYPLECLTYLFIFRFVLVKYSVEGTVSPTTTHVCVYLPVCCFYAMRLVNCVAL